MHQLMSSETVSTTPGATSTGMHVNQGLGIFSNTPYLMAINPNPVFWIWWIPDILRTTGVGIPPGYSADMQVVMVPSANRYTPVTMLSVEHLCRRSSSGSR